MNVLTAVTDSDWASDVNTRKSTSCGVLAIEGAVQGVYSRGQDVLALSSGEAEFYGAGSVLNEAIGLQGVYEEMGFPMSIVLQLDSTAAIGMIQRRGSGRARHIDLRHLHLQSKLRDGTVSALEKVPTASKKAYIGTKHFGIDRLDELMKQLGMSTPDGDVEMVGAVVEQLRQRGGKVHDAVPSSRLDNCLCFARALECLLGGLRAELEHH